MINFHLPSWVSEILKKPLQLKDLSELELNHLKLKLSRLNAPDPLVTVIIPAWNEEKGILHTLFSLAESDTTYATELMVVDNNSTDGTVALLKQLGIRTVIEKKQGVGHARTCGLNQAKGKYILTGDSDSLYPPGWITAMTQALRQTDGGPVYCVHGTYSFLPGINTPRWQYGCYEVMSSFIIRKKEKKQPFLNVLGFNCGFVKDKGIAVNGYQIEKQRTFRGAGGVIEDNATEDGMMALRLQQAGGKIKVEESAKARVWTSDRRIQMDGGLKKALLMRVKKHLFKR